MLHCLNTSGNLAGTCSDMTVLERQRARIKWQQQQQSQQQQQQHHHHQGYFCGHEFNGVFPSSLQVHSSQGLMMLGGTDDSGSALGEVVAQSMKPDPGLENGWPEMGNFEMPGLGFGSSGFSTGAAPAPGFDVNSAISRTCSSPPALAAIEAKGRDSVLPTGKMNSSTGKESFKKRKADKAQNPKVVAENDNKDKRIKVGADQGESKITGQTSSTKNNNTTTTDNNNNNNDDDDRETSADTSKENSKASEVQKSDYIHVRARRGQATDSHSLAERVRREKISERMKYLQDLVPGCNKITGKAGMLDEIINYVQSLQRQVEFLSMKLAAVNPRLDFNIDDMFAKEMFPACASSFPAIGMSSDMTNHAYLQFNSAQQQIISCGGLDTGINPPDMGLRRTISAPVSMPQTFHDSSCFTQILPSSTWEGDFHNLYNVAFDQARATSFPSHIFTGLVEASNLKMEM